MSSMTKPIILNETGLLIADKLDRQNDYLAMLAEERRSEIYSSMSQIASIVRGSSVDRLAKLFPVGDQLIMPWKDMDDENHNTDETAYQVAWDIVHHGTVELRDGRQVPGLFLQMHKCSVYGVQFSNYQAFKACPDGLAAGTYNVTFGGTLFSSGSAVSGSRWQFTLTEAVPAGGCLSGFEGMADQAASNWRVKSWASPTAASPIETVTVTAGSGGTNLGTMPLSQPAAGLNCMQRVAYGHNRWSTSALRQYLNADGTNWYSGKEDFDMRPNEYAKHGFMAGFDADFLNAVKPVKVTTALNAAEGFTGTTEDTYDTFFLPSLQQINVTPELANAEGDAFDYWKQALGSQNPVSTGNAIAYDAFKIPSIGSNTEQYVRLRSAYRGPANGMWIIATGYVIAYNHTYSAARFAPVCVIC